MLVNSYLPVVFILFIISFVVCACIVVIKMATGGGEDIPEVGKISVKPSKFTKDCPDIWFIQMESQFSIAGIERDRTKFDHAIQALDPDVLVEVGHVVLNPSREGKYEALKAPLLKVFEDTEQKRIKKLLNETYIGEQRPSRLLRQMRDLNQNRLPENVLKSV